MEVGNSEFVQFLTYCLPAVPILLALLVGWILALARWSRHPGVSLLAFLGFSIEIANVIASNMLSFWGPRVILRDGNHDDVGRFFLYVSIGRTVLFTAALILWTLAIFGGRTEKPRPQSMQNNR